MAVNQSDYVQILVDRNEGQEVEDILTVKKMI